MLIISARSYSPTYIVKLAVDKLREGKLAVLPTETVYGLAALVESDIALRRLQEAKGWRKSPFTVHVSSLDDVCNLAKVDNTSENILEQVWPGPLTAILKSSQELAKRSNSPSDKVGFRVPRHVLTLEILRKAGPCFMPSANKHDNPSPVDISDVLEDLDNAVDIVVDAGPCEIGIDSTVIDFTERPPLLVRPGALTIEQLLELGLEIRVPSSLADVVARKRYATGKAKVIAIYSESLGETLRKINEKISEYLQEGFKILLVASREAYCSLSQLLAHEQNENKITVIIYGSRSLVDVYPGFVYKVLRFICKSAFDIVIFECPLCKLIGRAIVDRILAAADEVI